MPARSPTAAASRESKRRHRSTVKFVIAINADSWRLPPHERSE